MKVTKKAASCCSLDRPIKMQDLKTLRTVLNTYDDTSKRPIILERLSHQANHRLHSVEHIVPGADVVKDDSKPTLVSRSA